MGKKNKRKQNSLSVFRYAYFRKPWHIIYNLKELCNILKYAKQRIFRGYCDADVWGLCDYYLTLFYHTLEELNNSKHGYPFDETEESWTKYLATMQAHFYNALEDNEGTYATITEWSAIDNLEKVYNELGKSLADIYDGDEVPDEVDEARERLVEASHLAFEFRNNELNSGLDMLRDKFWNLWD